MQVYPLRDILHPSATLFIQKCFDIGIQLTPSEIEGINYLTTMLIQTNLWNKFRVIYPFVGRSERSHSINLRNPFRHTIRWFNGSLIHDKLGVTNTGNGFGNTYFAPGWLSDNDIHVSAYTGTDWGLASTTCPLICATSGGSSSWIHAIYLRAREGRLDAYAPADQAPIFTYSCATAKYGTSVFTGTDASDRFHSEVRGLIVGVNGKTCYVYGEKYGREVIGNPPFPMRINPTTNNDPIEGIRTLYTQHPFLLFSNQIFGPSTVGQARANLRFISFGYALNQQENKIFYEIIEKFQEILSRNVGKIVLGPIDVKVADNDASVALMKINRSRKSIGRYIRPINDIRKLDPEESKRYNVDALSASIQIKSCAVFGARRVYLTDAAEAAVSVLSFVEN
jgi:hypothetical protein